jgi:hypothetical protein
MYENNINAVVYLLQELQKKPLILFSCTVYRRANITENAPVQVAMSIWKYKAKGGNYFRHRKGYWY